MAKKIRVGSHKIKTNKNGSKSIMERTNKSSWKVIQKVKPIKGK